MLVETIIMVIGLLLGIGVVQLWGLRMSGVLVVPLLAIYGLYDIDSLVIFIVSTLAAYIALYIVKKGSFAYGRSLLLIAIFSGALVPLLTLFFASQYYDPYLLTERGVPLHEDALDFSYTEVEFVGTILPGIAAYNFHQLSAGRRLNDAIMSLAVLIGLMIFAVVLLEPLAPVQANLDLPPILHSTESDIADIYGTTLPSRGYEGVVPLEIGGTAVIVGFALAELVRSRWGFRVDGMIAVPLLAIFSLQTVDAVILYLLVLPLTFLLIDRLEAQTGLYGRVTLALALVIGLIVALPIVPHLELDYGLIAFFPALFAGIGVYNFRRIPHSARFESLTLTAAIFTLSLAIIRPFSTPAPDGFLQTVTVSHLIAGVVLVSIGVWICWIHEQHRPSLEGVDIQ